MSSPPRPPGGDVLVLALALLGGVPTRPRPFRRPLARALGELLAAPSLDDTLCSRARSGDGSRASGGASGSRNARGTRPNAPLPCAAVTQPGGSAADGRSGSSVPVAKESSVCSTASKSKSALAVRLVCGGSGSR
eukprot:7262957-Prymnesium_polylepis.1